MGNASFAACVAATFFNLQACTPYSAAGGEHGSGHRAYREQIGSNSQKFYFVSLVGHWLAAFSNDMLDIAIGLHLLL